MWWGERRGGDDGCGGERGEVVMTVVVGRKRGSDDGCGGERGEVVMTVVVGREERW